MSTIIDADKCAEYGKHGRITLFNNNEFIVISNFCDHPKVMCQ